MLLPFDRLLPHQRCDSQFLQGPVDEPLGRSCLCTRHRVAGRKLLHRRAFHAGESGPQPGECGAGGGAPGLLRIYEIGNDAFLRLALRCYGGTDADVGASPFLHHGQSRRLPHREADPGAWCEPRGHHGYAGRRHHLLLRFLRGDFSVRRQEGLGVLYDFESGPHCLLRRHRFL